MSQTSWAKRILIKAKREDKLRANKRVKRQADRKAKSLIRVQNSASKQSAGTPAPEPSEQK
jgi:hypothetical protein